MNRRCGGSRQPALGPRSMQVQFGNKTSGSKRSQPRPLCSWPGRRAVRVEMTAPTALGVIREQRRRPKGSSREKTNRYGTLPRTPSRSTARASRSVRNSRPIVAGMENHKVGALLVAPINAIDAWARTKARIAQTREEEKGRLTQGAQAEPWVPKTRGARWPASTQKTQSVRGGE